MKLELDVYGLLLEQVLGTDELNTYLSKYRIELDPHLSALVGRFVRGLDSLHFFFTMVIDHFNCVFKSLLTLFLINLMKA